MMRTIQIAEGNDFSVLIPVYNADGSVIDAGSLSYLSAKLTRSNSEDNYEVTITTQNEHIVITPTNAHNLPRGSYDIVITGEYDGKAVAFPYNNIFAICKWQNGVEISNGGNVYANKWVMLALYNTDAELETLKQQYAQRIVELQTEIDKYQSKITEIDGMAQEATSQEILDKVADFDISIVAKQGANENATNTAILQAVLDNGVYLDEAVAAAQDMASLGREVEIEKAAIVSSIIAMGGTATTSMSLTELAQAIERLNLVQLGECEYDIPIENAEEAVNLASTHCTKYIDDTTTQMYSPLIVDAWDAVESVRYKQLKSVNFSYFSSFMRENYIFMLTNCKNLKTLIFDELTSIDLGSSSANYFVVGTNNLTTIDLPKLKTLGHMINQFIFTGVSKVTSLNLPALESIGVMSNCAFFKGLNSLEELSLPSLEYIGNRYNEKSCFTGLTKLKKLSLPRLKSNGNQDTRTSDIFSGAVNLEHITIGFTNSFGEGSIVKGTSNSFDGVGINPTNTYNDAEKWAILENEIRENWFANLYDYTGGAAGILRLHTNLVAHLSSETIQVVTDRNWTIVTFNV